MEHFDYKTEYNDITFQLCNTARIEEREIHNYHELLFFLDGEADCLTADSSHSLRPGCLLLIPRGTYHFLRFPKEQGFMRLKIGFPQTILAGTPLESRICRFQLMSQPGQAVLELLQKLCRLLRQPDTAYTRFHAYAAFMLALTELCAAPAPKLPGSKQPLSQVMDYINSHLSQNLTAEYLSATLNLSASTLTHRFKQVYGISLHRYITQRRMFHAQSLIDAGHLPTKIFSTCGYGDYSSFYRAYVDYFGHPPSAK